MGCCIGAACTAAMQSGSSFSSSLSVKRLSAAGRPLQVAFLSVYYKQVLVYFVNISSAACRDLRKAAAEEHLRTGLLSACLTYP